MEENKKMPDGQFKWYLIPTSFKPLGELREVIIAEMDINVTNDLTNENTSLKETIAALEERNEVLVNEIECLKHNNNTACILAMEWGYKQCEKGNNIDAAFLNYNELINKPRR